MGHSDLGRLDQRMGANSRHGRVGRWRSRRATQSKEHAVGKESRKLLDEFDQRMRANRPAGGALAGRLAPVQKRLDTSAGWLSSERGIGSAGTTSRRAGLAPLRGRPNSRALAQIPRDELRGSSGRTSTPAYWRTSRVACSASATSVPELPRTGAVPAQRGSAERMPTLSAPAHGRTSRAPAHVPRTGAPPTHRKVAVAPKSHGPRSRTGLRARAP